MFTYFLLAESRQLNDDYKLTPEDKFRLWKFGIRTEGFDHLDRLLRDFCYPMIKTTLSKKNGLKSLLDERVPVSILDEIVADIIGYGLPRLDDHHCYNYEDSDDSEFW